MRHPASIEKTRRVEGIYRSFALEHGKDGSLDEVRKYSKGMDEKQIIALSKPLAVSRAKVWNFLEVYDLSVSFVARFLGRNEKNFRRLISKKAPPLGLVDVPLDLLRIALDSGKLKPGPKGYREESDAATEASYRRAARLVASIPELVEKTCHGDPEKTRRAISDPDWFEDYFWREGCGIGRMRM